MFLLGENWLSGFWCDPITEHFVLQILNNIMEWLSQSEQEGAFEWLLIVVADLIFNSILKV